MLCFYSREIDSTVLCFFLYYQLLPTKIQSFNIHTLLFSVTIILSLPPCNHHELCLCDEIYFNRFMYVKRIT
ncbi:hypothetical protein AtNW77_Chr1g0022731 [Arabidopsis thaliana]